MQEKAQEEFKKLVIKTLQDDEVKTETVELFKSVVGDKQSEEVVAKLMKTVFLRQDTLDTLTSLLVKSAEQAFSNERTHEMFVVFLQKLVHSPKLKLGVMENLIYSPTRSLFTLGYSGDSQLSEEQKVWELEMQQKREEQARTFINDRTERNRYKGMN